ncbi:MAG: hypothetical protein AMJ43_07205 [Coxiella sp. DG_40]|nr:MAG: hypothetical protein AMJ43_07205 [Coxiella sp. DG_40]
MKLVIIGGYGQVGQEFQKHVRAEDLILLSHIQIEVVDEESVRSCLEGFDFDVVINLAAFHNTDQCEEHKEKAFLVNCIGAHNVAKVSSELNRKVVFFSTDYVFGLDSCRDTPYLESDIVAPVNTYGVSKAAGEMMVRAINKNHLIVRSSSLYGVVTSKKGWTFPEKICKMAKAGELVRIVNDQVMSPTYTYELVERTIAFLEKDFTGTIHIAGRGRCSWYEFACATLELLGIDYKIEPVSSNTFASKASRPAYSVLGSAFFEKYRVKPMSFWKEALKQYLIEKGELRQ